MNYSTIIYEVKGHIAYITLTSTGDGTGINPQIAGELNDACREIVQNEDIRVVVITGTGNKVFCRGSESELRVSTEEKTTGDQPVIDYQGVASSLAAISSDSAEVIVLPNMFVNDLGEVGIGNRALSLVAAFF